MVSDLVGVIDLKRMINGRCNVYILGKLPHPRTNHTLTYDMKKNIIYILGGLEDNIPTSTCLKMDLENHNIKYIEDMPVNGG